MKELHDKEYYRLVKELKEIRKIVDDIKKLIISPKYDGEIEYSNRYNAGKSHKLIKLNLRVEDEN
tara:strand:+ start:429 stop:623 length:195 start_codon:yes stop_codon:yes gene_type:complete